MSHNNHSPSVTGIGVTERLLTEDEVRPILAEAFAKVEHGFTERAD